MSDRFLIDECLSVALAPIAHEMGFEAHHVAHCGLSGASDSRVFAEVVDGGFVFVTNNRDDFMELAEKVDLHAGLVVILPSCRRAAQEALFKRALEHFRKVGGLINRVLEIGEAGDIRVFELPKPKTCGPGMAEAASRFRTREM